MRRKKFPFLLTALLAAVLALPAHAMDEDKKGEDDGAKSKGDATSEVVAEAKKVDPIKKLVEIQIDPFLVAARQFNVPLPGRVRTSQELLDRLHKLGEDESVGAILLNLQGIGLSLPDVEELRSGLDRFRKTGKEVKAFLNSGDPNSFLLACAADEIAIAPTGILVIPGIGRLFPFMRGMYQMQGIEYDVITAGEFKYPGFNNRREPGEHFVKEFSQLMDSWYSDYVKMIADGRDLSTKRVKEIIDMALLEPEDARNYDLVDVIAYYDDYRDRILRREKFKKGGNDGSGLSNITSIQDLLTQITKEMKKAQDRYKAVGPKIAILHARGPIVDADMGAGLASTLIMRDQFVKSIEEVRKNKTIRAVVLHVDSPGGSAYASDIIWKKLKELDEEKPLVACMGSVAASGGYYISCPCRLIFAQPTTITGSIGVLSIFANQASALNRRDINLYEIKRGERSLLGSSHREMGPADRKLIQDFILDTYDQFLDRVAAGRKMPVKELQKLAGGRVYTGRDALDVGLVDRLGGLTDAVKAVREMADIPASAEIKLVHYPRPSSLGELAETFLGLSAAVNLLNAANTPAPKITFENQLKYFSRVGRPLCWMPLVDLDNFLTGGSQPNPAVELLGLPPQPVLPTLP